MPAIIAACARQHVLKTRSRLHQVGMDEKLDDWMIASGTNSRCARRAGRAHDARGVLREDIAPPRSLVEPMRHGRCSQEVRRRFRRLELLNQPSDPSSSEALTDFYKSGSSAGIDGYSHALFAWRGAVFVVVYRDAPLPDANADGAADAGGQTTISAVLAARDAGG